MPDRSLQDKTDNGKSFVKNEGALNPNSGLDHGADPSGKALDFEEKRTKDGKHLDGSHPEELEGPLHDEGPRSGTRTDQ